MKARCAPRHAFNLGIRRRATAVTERCRFRILDRIRHARTMTGHRPCSNQKSDDGTRRPTGTSPAAYKHGTKFNFTKPSPPYGVMSVHPPIHPMWYYSVNDTQHGPADANAVAQLVANGTITAQTLVWTEGMGNWQQAGQSALSAYFTGTTGATPSLPWQSGGSTQQKNWKTLLFSAEGRIPRRQYWGGALAVAGILVALTGIAVAIYFMAGTGAGFILPALAYLPAVWSGIVLQIKRWHDHGKSGWHVLVVLIPIVGAIWAFIKVGCQRGNVGPNLYGEDPT